MLKRLIDMFNGFEKITFKILKKGLQFCFILSILAIIILLTYEFYYHSPFTYHIGINLFRQSIIFAIEFIICSFITDGIKKQQI